MNLLVYAYNSDAPFHEPFKDWWESCLTQRGTVGPPGAVMLVSSV